MRCQKITKRKQRTIKPLWGLTILLLGFALSGWLSPVAAEVTLCGEVISPDLDGNYRLRGHLECSSTILNIAGLDEEYAEFDLRGFTATGNTENYGIRIRDGANHVRIVGGNFRRCETALRVQTNYCDIKNFKAIDSSDKAIRIQGHGNTIVKSLCQNAGNDCFELSADSSEGNSAEWCIAIKSGTPEEEAQGIQFRGPGHAYRCTAIGSTAEGFQIQEGVSGVMIEQCLAVNNAQGGIVIEAGATGNSIERNIARANGDGIDYFDLSDGNDDCDDNIWYRNRFRTINLPCIE